LSYAPVAVRLVEMAAPASRLRGPVRDPTGRGYRTPGLCPQRTCVRRRQAEAPCHRHGSTAATSPTLDGPARQASFSVTQTSTGASTRSTAAGAAHGAQKNLTAHTAASAGFRLHNVDAAGRAIPSAAVSESR